MLETLAGILPTFEVRAISTETFDLICIDCHPMSDSFIVFDVKSTLFICVKAKVLIQEMIYNFAIFFINTLIVVPR